MEERRIAKRRNLIFYLQVFDNKTDELLGFAVDITHEGLMMLSNKAIVTEKMFQLRMTLPEQLSDKSQVTFAAQSIWCKQDVNTDYFDTGFQLIEVEPETLSVITQLITHFGFKD
ncbi:PilZ domain-containing protein [candidate division KSB1 bacterium]|nr:PilZ domain-containing protein [candidate division KSB1 bacterium]